MKHFRRLGESHKGVLLATLLFALATAAGADEQPDPFKAMIRTTPHLTPAAEQKSFTLPPGFEIQLVAAEPDIQKPLNLAFDARGRLWVTDSTEYPFPVPVGQKGRDTVKILEDTNGDGRADRVTTFVDGLNIPIGLYPYKNGVVVFSIPDISFYEDTDGDGRADKRTKLYGPMGFDRDTHGLNNSFRRGFDGWLYACHGFNNQTRVAGRDGHVVGMQSGNTYRMRLDSSRVEHFTHGQVNPFGMALDPAFNIFTADCHSKPLTQLVRGAYYPSFGKPHDGLGFIPPMMQHSHGSTAIAGVASYDAPNFPPEYRGNLFSGNVMTSRVNRNSLATQGATFKAREEPDFVSTSDPWFRPVDVRLGPDGALYVADFYNRIIGHYEVPLDHPGRDRTSGRIWRIVYTGTQTSPVPETKPVNLAALPFAELIEQLDSRNLTVRELATDRISDEFGRDALPAVRKAFLTSTSPRLRTHALWVLFRLGAVDDEVLASAARDASSRVRIQGQKVLSETSQWSGRRQRLALDALHDRDAFVRLAAVDALGRHPEHTNVLPLLSLLEQTPLEDGVLHNATRRALRAQYLDERAFETVRIENLDFRDAHAIAGVVWTMPTPASAEYLFRFVQAHDLTRTELGAYLPIIAARIEPQHTAALAKFVQERYDDAPQFQLDLLAAILQSRAEAGQPATDLFRDWASDVIGRVSAAIGPQGPEWMNSPIPGKPQADDPWVLQKRESQDGDRESLFLSSLPRGERLTGRLRSREFDCPKRLSFYCAGHVGFPNQPVFAENFVRLRDAKTDEVLRETQPPRHDTARKIEWDLADVAGRRVYVEIVDGDADRAFAWIAVGRFSPHVVHVPQVEPRRSGARMATIGRLVSTLKLEQFRPQLVAWLERPHLTPAVKASLARAVLPPDAVPSLTALADLLADAALSPSLQTEAVRAIVENNRSGSHKALMDAFRALPQRSQEQLALDLAGSAESAEVLLRAVFKGVASARLLQLPELVTRLRASGLGNVEKHIERLTADLPSRDEATRMLIERRRKGLLTANASLERGKTVFTKNCAACHKIGEEGKLIGPQLDGIGNRGSARLLEDLLDPNRNVDVAFRTVALITTGGQVKTGLVRREEGGNLVLADNKGKEFTLRKDDVAERQDSKLSLMPANVAQQLSDTEFYDLLAYLLAQTRAVEKENGKE